MADIKTETVSYSAQGTALEGFLARDAGASGKRPGVLVIHEWWGLNDYIRKRARMLAELGYVALAVDMYGDGKTASDPDGAGALMNGVLSNIDAATARLEAARDVLAKRPDVDPRRLAAIGYCFGGAMALHCARIGMDLKAAVSFHGALGSTHTPAKGGVKARVLVCHGADDSLVPDADVEAFKKEMEAAGAHYQFNAYGGALHGFSNPEATANGEKYGLPLKYNSAVDQQSWGDMKALFDEVLRAA